MDFDDFPRRRGGQPGNSNARKHGFYSKALKGQDREDLAEASVLYGLDEEIALVRSRLKAVIENDPNNLRLISEAASTLARLMRTSHKLGYTKAEKLDRISFKVLHEYGQQLGWDTKRICDYYMGLMTKNLDETGLRFPQK